ncbi:hypothetical protein BDV96DRAFT_583112, partial [Lophiotrema nucula]
MRPFSLLRYVSAIFSSLAAPPGDSTPRESGLKPACSCGEELSAGSSELLETPPASLYPQEAHLVAPLVSLPCRRVGVDLVASRLTPSQHRPCAISSL